MICSRLLAVHNLFHSLVVLEALGHDYESLALLYSSYAEILEDPDDPGRKIAKILEIAMDLGE
jgi:hypothetical protein